ncbi:MAG: hypothetical protein OXN88_07250 [Chloroflexota bacterium]|nr:hypothetical protein [Chloroflexota bacterium]
MAETLHLSGIIRNVRYLPQFHSKTLKRFDLASFDINLSDASCVVRYDEEYMIGLSKWVSPKRTRSFPFSRIYGTYHLPKIVTVIPIIKDEGYEGDNDRINFMTLSWMNLMDVYIILAWYDDAVAHPDARNKITNQRLNNSYVVEKLHEIRLNRKSAMHWNEMHFENDFESVYRRAVGRYQQLGARLGCKMHSESRHLNTLAKYLENGEFSLDGFASQTLPRSYSAAKRETLTRHKLERLTDGNNAHLAIQNRLGGTYHLTADEIFHEDGQLVIQESKNTKSKGLPTIGNIQDGLFKCILHSNIDELKLGETAFKFSTRLKLTGKFQGSLILPVVDKSELELFLKVNQFGSADVSKIRLLNREANMNPGLSIHIAGYQ